MKVEDLEFSLKRLRLEPDDIVVIAFDEITPFNIDYLEEIRTRFKKYVPNRCIVLSHRGRIYTLDDACIDEIKERRTKV